MIKITDMQAGKAGEYMVCADIILMGHVAYLSEQALSYDVVADVDGRLIRIQVKTTRLPKAVPQRKTYTPAYIFHIRRMGKGGRRSYTDRDVDMFALVALDTRIIGYVSEKKVSQSMLFRIPDYEGAYYGERNADRNRKIIELRNNGASFTEISKAIGIDRSAAQRITSGKEGIRTKGLYLDSLTFEQALADL